MKDGGKNQKSETSYWLNGKCISTKCDDLTERQGLQHYTVIPTLQNIVLPDALSENILTVKELREVKKRSQCMFKNSV